MQTIHLGQIITMMSMWKECQFYFLFYACTFETNGDQFKMFRLLI